MQGLFHDDGCLRRLSLLLYKTIENPGGVLEDDTRISNT
jgi:hypothetical protein